MLARSNRKLDNLFVLLCIKKKKILFVVVTLHGKRDQLASQYIPITDYRCLICMYNVYPISVHKVSENLSFPISKVIFYVENVLYVDCKSVTLLLQYEIKARKTFIGTDIIVRFYRKLFNLIERPIEQVPKMTHSFSFSF